MTVAIGVGIELHGVVCRFGRGAEEHAALAGLDLGVPRGRVTAVVGPSGAGKSTLLRVVAGLLAPDEGDVLFDGTSVLALAPEKRRLGMVFQSYALFPHLSVADNVAFPLRVRGAGRRAARRRVGDLLARLEIEPLAGRYPHQISGGERQRVALARALASEPRALLLDEPLAALDARLRLALRDDLAARLRAAGLTALYVTHDQEEAMALGDRVAVLRAGRLEQLGTPEELYRAPATPFVAGFVGEANFLPVRWRRGERELAGPLGTWRVGGAAAARFDGAVAGNGSGGTPGRPAGGAPSRLMVRPEAIRLGAGEAAGEDAAASLSGRVLATTFLGDRRRLTVAVAGAAAPLKVDLPAAAAASPAPGEVVPLLLDLAAAVLLPAPEAEAGSEASAEAVIEPMTEPASEPNPEPEPGTDPEAR